MDNSDLDLQRIPPGIAKFLTRYSTLLNEKKFGKDGFASEFGVIKQHSIDFKKDPAGSSIEGSSEENKKKNRYKDILPFDKTRVILNQIDDVPGSDYINASCIKGVEGKVCYLASQGPMPSTVADFWRMICQYKVEVIVMACREIEMGRHRCQRYWPNEQETETFDEHIVTLLYENDHSEELKERQMLVTVGKHQHKVTQYHYTSWPDHDAPSGSRPILNLLKLVRQKQPGDDPPLLIHCSAGCGRTGAIIAVDYARKIIEKEGEINIFSIVRELRRQRPAMVQTKEQYFFLFQAIYDMIRDAYPKKKVVSKQMSNEMPTYVNVDISPTPTYANVNIEPALPPPRQSTPPLYENLNEFSSYSPVLGRKFAVKPMDDGPTKRTVETAVHSSKPQENQHQKAPVVHPPIPQDRNFPDHKAPVVHPPSPQDRNFPDHKATAMHPPSPQDRNFRDHKAHLHSRQDRSISVDKDAPLVPPKSPVSSRKLLAEQPTSEATKVPSHGVSIPSPSSSPLKPAAWSGQSHPVSNPQHHQLDPPRKPARQGVRSAIFDSVDGPSNPPPKTLLQKSSEKAPVDSLYAEVKKGHSYSVDQESKTFIEVWSSKGPKHSPPKPAPSVNPNVPPLLPARTPESYTIVRNDNSPVGDRKHSSESNSSTKYMDSPPDEDRSAGDQSANKQWLSAGVNKLKKIGNIKWVPHKRSSSGADVVVTPPAYDGGSPDQSNSMFYLGDNLGFKCRLPSRPVGPRDPPQHWPTYPKWPVTKI